MRVFTIQRTDKNFCPAVFVEEKHAAVKLLGLRAQKIHQHGFTRTGWPDNGGMPHIARMEIKIIRRARRGVKYRHRITPVIARYFPHRIIMH